MVDYFLIPLWTLSVKNVLYLVILIFTPYYSNIMFYIIYNIGHI